MDGIIDCLVRAGYYRARMSTISDFDKIIGGMAWAMQLFSHDININVFYADSLDLGQKIGLTERLVMVLLASKCPYRVEPHQIVGLDYDSLLPVVRWLMKRSEELRREHEAFNRLLALRHYFRATNRQANRSNWCHVVHVDQFRDVPRTRSDRTGVQAKDRDSSAESAILAKIKDTYKDNEQVSFLKLAALMRTSHEAAAATSNAQVDSADGDSSQLVAELVGFGNSSRDSYDDDVDAGANAERPPRVESPTCFTDDDAKTTISGESLAGDNCAQSASSLRRRGENLAPVVSFKEMELQRKLDLELLATNQKILNLLKKLDLMPSHLEIRQYQARYVELHQQLIVKNKTMRKLYDLFNSLDVIRLYLEKELNLLESIAHSLGLISESSGSHRDSFMQQMNEIAIKIVSIRDEMSAKVGGLRNKCDSLYEEQEQLTRQLDLA